MTLPETSSSNILFRRAQRLRKLTGNPHLRSKGEILSSHLTGKELALMTFVRPFALSFKEPITYGFNYGELGLAFIGIFVGAIFIYFPFWLWHKYSYGPLFDKQNGKVAPEKWLEPDILGAWAIPICMFGFGWTATASIHWICLRGNDFFRASIGGALPLVARAMFNNLQANGPRAFPVAWGSVLMGCISIVMGPIPILLYKYGPKLRTISKYALDPSGGSEQSSEKQASK
ncbi:hypothetical protein NDA18_002541 [Ustilago nuda]|nr:hypothetical protein NDA18_002541 [Ustilago nuda]